MPFKHINNLRFFYFESLDHPGITHGIAARIGGESTKPWASLNVGSTVGDVPEVVDRNIEKIFNALELDTASKFDVWQIHSSKFQIAEYPRGEAPPVRADIILTNKPHITLLMRFADCVPILLYEPVLHVIALVHAGREGLAKKAPAVAVEAMVERFGVNPENIIAGIGPSICSECYEVGEEVYENFIDTLGEEKSSGYFQSIQGNYHLDLWASAKLQLQDAGVDQIEVSEICTAMNLNDWYSHRGENGKTGRFAALITLNE